VLLRFENGAKGCFSVGQVLAGHKNAFQIEVNGRGGSLRWDQEAENQLWIGRHGTPNIVMGSDPDMLIDASRAYTHLPGGHQKGWSDAFRNVVGDIYQWIEAGGAPETRPATVCSFADATQVCLVIDAMIRSHLLGGTWEQVADISEPVPLQGRQPMAQRT
jgi:predicted dehydrogenase